MLKTFLRVFLILGLTSGQVAFSQSNQIEIVNTPIESILRFCPKHVGGDTEFKGHGPEVTAKARLYIYDNFLNGQSELWVSLFLNAIETRKDWTQAKGTWNSVVWTAPRGYQIIDFSPKFSSTSYQDSNHDLDIPGVKGGDGLVRSFEIMGDRYGKDISVRTDTLDCTGSVYMNVYFNNVTV